MHTLDLPGAILHCWRGAANPMSCPLRTTAACALLHHLPLLQPYTLQMPLAPPPPQGCVLQPRHEAHVGLQVALPVHHVVEGQLLAQLLEGDVRLTALVHLEKVAAGSIPAQQAHQHVSSSRHKPTTLRMYCRHCCVCIVHCRGQAWGTCLACNNVRWGSAALQRCPVCLLRTHRSYTRIFLGSVSAMASS
jgi:hypothetical protein